MGRLIVEFIDGAGERAFDELEDDWYVQDGALVVTQRGDVIVTYAAGKWSNVRQATYRRRPDPAHA